MGRIKKFEWCYKMWLKCKLNKINTNLLTTVRCNFWTHFSLFNDNFKSSARFCSLFQRPLKHISDKMIPLSLHLPWVYFRASAFTSLWSFLWDERIGNKNRVKGAGRGYFFSPLCGACKYMETSRDVFLRTSIFGLLALKRKSKELSLFVPGWYFYFRLI